MDGATSGIKAGTWYLTPTAFGSDGRLDLASQRRLVESAISWGVDGLTVMGVMSEPGTLTDEERAAVLGAIFEAASGRVPIVVGCSAAGAALVAVRAVQAARLGAAAIMVAAPPLLSNIDLLPKFFAAAAAQAGLPIVIQDEPAATGVTLPVSVLSDCLAAAGAHCAKIEDPPTPAKIGRLLEAHPDLTVFGGLGGVAALLEMRRGAAGTMTGFAFPEVLRAVRLGLEAGDWAGAAAIFDRFLPLIVFESQVGVGLAIRKEVLRRRGVLEAGLTRGPVRSIDATTANELDDVLARVGLRPSGAPLDLGNELEPASAAPEGRP